MTTKTKPKRKQKSEKKAKPKLSLLKKKAWALLSQVVRRSAANPSGFVNCYTCDNYSHWTEMQAGHAIGGRHNSVLFDEELLRCQCVACNIFKRGNYQIFVTRLITENGFEWWVQKLADSNRTIKYDRSALLEKYESYKERLAKLEC